MQAGIPSRKCGRSRVCFIPKGRSVKMPLLDGKIKPNTQLWNTLYCGRSSQNRLLKGKRGMEQVKKKKKIEGAKHTLENSTNSDGLFIRGKLRCTKLWLLDDGRGRN